MSTWVPIDGKKPSPSRPARLAAASECPPITIGTAFLTGLGLELTSSQFTNWPLKLTPSSAHSLRITAMYSSVRGAALLERHADRLELLLEPADADAELDAAAAHVVERRHLLGQHERIAQRQDDDAGHEAQPGRDGGHRRHPDQRIGQGAAWPAGQPAARRVGIDRGVFVREDDVVDGDDGVEACRFRKLDHADCAREIGEGVVAEVEGVLHSKSFTASRYCVTALRWSSYVFPLIRSWIALVKVVCAST